MTDTDRIKHYKSRNQEIVDQIRRQAGAVPQGDLRTVAEQRANELAATMALLHGGDWRVQIDHLHSIVVVTRVLAPRNRQ